MYTHTYTDIHTHSTYSVHLCGGKGERTSTVYQTRFWLTAIEQEKHKQFLKVSLPLWNTSVSKK